MTAENRELVNAFREWMKVYCITPMNVRDENLDELIVFQAFRAGAKYGRGCIDRVIQDEKVL